MRLVRGLSQLWKPETLNDRCSLWQGKIRLMLMRRILLVTGLALSPLACTTDGSGRHDGSPEAIDAGRDAGPPPRCRSFGAFARRMVTRTDGGRLNQFDLLSDPFVLHDGQRFRMWFTSVAFARDQAVLNTAYADSDDGVQFANLSDPVLTPVADGWDSRGIETVSVASAADGGWLLLYTGDRPPGPAHHAIGLARSTDGVHWTKQGDGPILAPMNDWEQPVCADPPGCTAVLGGVAEPSILRQEPGLRLWYAALRYENGYWISRIGHASSPDGLTWTREANPVLEPGPRGSWDDQVVGHVNVTPDPGGGFHMFYFGGSAADQDACPPGCSFAGGSIGHAFSEDGLAWTRDAEPVLQGRPGEWDGWAPAGPMAIVRDGQLYLWYFAPRANDSLELHLGLATAPCRD